MRVYWEIEDLPLPLPRFPVPLSGFSTSGFLRTLFSTNRWEFWRFVHPGMVGVIKQHGQQRHAVIIAGEGVYQGAEPLHPFDLEFVPFSQAGF